ncbi:MAG TPA: tyrosine-type recombinase/integrase, partial [Anaeromyxobacteraceae bacterium]
WQDVQGAMERAREAAGLAGIWVHDLRRSFVTLARRSGLPESVVARFSGHRTAAVFKRYNIIEEQDLKAAVQAVNRTRKAAESAAVWARNGRDLPEVRSEARRPRRQSAGRAIGLGGCGGRI